MEEKMEKKEKQRFHKNCKGFYRKYTSTKICKKKKKNPFLRVYNITVEKDASL